MKLKRLALKTGLFLKIKKNLNSYNIKSKKSKIIKNISAKNKTRYTRK